MLNFKKIEFEDIPEIRKYFEISNSRSCENAIGSDYMWRNYFDNYFAVYDETFTMSEVNEDKIFFSFPIGKNPIEMINQIEECCRYYDIPLIFHSLNTNQTEELKKIYPSAVTEFDRDWFEYVYNSESIRDLIGKSYSQQRNQINKFERNYPSYSFEKITTDNIPELIRFNDHFRFHALKSDDNAEHELKMCHDILENFTLYNLPGYLLKINGDIVGYTVGEIVGDTLFIHIEKADTSYRGVYQKLSNLFLKEMVDDSVKYVNREEDCGDPGLRKSKMSYNPVSMIEKHFVICNYKER